MNQCLSIVSVVAALVTATPALSEVVVTFTEGAPKDRFVIENRGGCAIGARDLVIDLSTAPAGLIFDVTGGGAGVEVFQPFEVVAGLSSLARQPSVSDGDQAIVLPIGRLGADDRVAFTIDVDDTTSVRRTVVTGSEIAGAQVRLGEAVTRFDTKATARLPRSGCLS